MDEYRELRQYLAARLAELEHRLHTIESDRPGATNPPDQDWIEQAVRRQNDVVLDQLTTEVRLQMAAIQAALTRLDVGTYGKCRTCGEPLTPQRLAALPYATRCLECATQAEHETRHRY